MTEESKTRRRIDWTAVFTTLLLIVAIVTMIVPMIFGIEIFGIQGRAGVEKLLASFGRSPFAPLEVIAAVAVLSLTGFPIFVLIGGAAAIFGSVEGFLYSWIGSLIGAVTGFWIGRVSGGSLVKRYGSRTVHSASELLGRRGIVASAVVRIIPSGPAIMVNMIAGASHMKLWQFVVGTGLGSIPKTAAFAFVGGNLVTFLRDRNPIDLVIAGGALLASILLGLWVRHRFLRPTFKRPPPAPSEPGPGRSVH